MPGMMRIPSMAALALACLASWINLAVSAEIPTSPARTTNDRVKPKTVMVLGVSWLPAFCEGKAKRPECADQTADRVDARQFSLNGLWAMRKSYCGVDAALKEQDKKRKWLDMPELALEEDVRLELARAMPGVASGLDRHEWIKHGTCTGEIATRYYERSLKLLAELNTSAVGTLFATNIGKVVTEAQVKAAFTEAFGEKAADKIKMRCRKDGDRSLISGLTIGLGAVEDSDEGLAVQVAAAGKTKFGCAEGIVDAAGQQ